MATSSRPKRAAAASSPWAYNTETQYPVQQDSPSQTLPAGKTPPHNSKQMRHVVRDRLLDTIRKAIGREIAPRHRGPIDPRQDNKEPPNLYKWRFSSEYPRFPDGGVTRWTVREHETCVEALDHGWLSVVALPTPTHGPVSNEEVHAGFDASKVCRLGENQSFRSFDETPTEVPPQFLAQCASEDTQGRDDTSNILDAIRHHELGELVRSLAEETEAIDDISSLQECFHNVECLILQREAALQEVNELLKTQLRSLSDVKDDIVNQAKTKIVRLEKTIKDQSSQHQQLEMRYEALEKEFICASEEIANLKQKLEHPIDEVAEARRLDELEDLKTAIQDLRKKRDAQEEDHLAQLKRAREESMEKGFRQGEASVTRKSNDAVIVADLKGQLKDIQNRNIVEVRKSREQATYLERLIEDIHAKHLIEVARAREEGRREDEELSQLLEGHNVNYHGRKRREIRTIYHNWKNVLQNILPKSMMPEGITPSDRTLILLARLSRVENDPQKATALLEREIEHRNAQLPDARRDFTVTNADIDRVLASLGEEFSIQRASEVSSTPVPASHHAGRRANDFHHSDGSPLQDRERSQGNEPVSGPTFQSNKRKPVISRPSLDCGSRSISKKLATQKNSRHNEKPAAITWSGTSNSPHQLIRIRNSMPQTESITAEFYPGDTISPKRTFRKSLLNPENSYLDSLTQDHDLAMMPAGATEIPGRELKRATTISILEEIEALPFPSNSLVPSSLQDFPMDFVRECIRGDNATFAICGRATRDKQIVNWPEMMKLNPETHPFCPSPGNNGALAFVDGRPNTGEVGKTYPTLLRENVGFYKYIGNYKVVERIVMPIEIWKACTDDERLGVVDEIENREWGQTLLTFKGLCTNATDKEEKRINDLLGFFERSEEPCLRMSWTLVQFVSFEEKDYNILVGALKEYKMAREMEHGIEDDASSVASNNTSRGLSADSANQVVNRGIQQPDQLQLSREDLQISSPKDINGIPASISEGEFRPVNKNTPGPAKVAIMSTPTASLALTNNSSPFVLKVPVSVRSTIPSSTNDSSDSTPPDCLSQRENGRWHVHAGRSSRVLDLTISNPEPQSAESQTTSVPIKRQYEEEVDLYGVSPPLQSQQAPVGQMNIARPPSRTLQEILASFSNAKRRRLADSNEKNAGE